MASGIIVDVNEIDFEYEVLAYSNSVPVVVDFWAEWCRPCKTLGPMLERLAIEANGHFRLARVDADANPNLTLRYRVHSLPTVKAFSSGEVAAEFVGMQPEPRLREFLARIPMPSQATIQMEKAAALVDEHSWVDAETIFREILEQEPEHPAALLGLAKALLGQNRADEALPLLRRFPASRQYSQAVILIPYGEALIALQKRALPADTDLDATLENSIRLAGRGRYPAALDGLLEILRQNRGYRNGLARQIILGVLELLGETDPLTRQYRSELASILF